MIAWLLHFMLINKYYDYIFNQKQYKNETTMYSAQFPSPQIHFCFQIKLESFILNTMHVMSSWSLIFLSNAVVLSNLRTHKWGRRTGMLNPLNKRNMYSIIQYQVDIRISKKKHYNLIIKRYVDFFNIFIQLSKI